MFLGWGAFYIDNPYMAGVMGVRCTMSASLPPFLPILSSCCAIGYDLTPTRGIEPRSPAWQAGILATILCRKIDTWRQPHAARETRTYTHYTNNTHTHIPYNIYHTSNADNHNTKITRCTHIHIQYIPYTLIPVTYQKANNEIYLYYFINTKPEQVITIYINKYTYIYIPINDIHNQLNIVLEILHCATLLTVCYHLGVIDS